MAIPSTAAEFDPSGLDLLDALNEGVVVHGPGGEIVYANAAGARLLRTPREVILSRGTTDTAWTILFPDGTPMTPEDFPASRILQGESRISGMVLGLRANERERANWFSVNAVAREKDGLRYAVVIFSEHPTPWGFGFRDLVEASQDIVLVTDADLSDGGPRIVYANPAFSRVTGYSVEEAIGRPPSFLQGVGTSGKAKREIHAALKAGLPVRTTILNYSKAGEPYWVDLQIVPLHDMNGALTHFAAIERDMNDSQEQLEAALHAASHDPLTGALNRRGFYNQAGLMQARARREGGLNALLLIDIDHFKQVNDRFGHGEGDRLLTRLSEIIQQRLRSTDLFARLGGEEFALFVSVSSLLTALQLAESIRLTLADQLRAGPEARPVTVSIGIAASDGRETLSAVVREADKALYQAKASGRNRTVCERLPGDGAPMIEGVVRA